MVLYMQRETVWKTFPFANIQPFTKINDDMDNLSIHQSNLDVIALETKHQADKKRSLTEQRIYSINQSLIEDGIEPNDFKEVPKSYFDGLFDGSIGLEPSSPEIWEYWEGYCFGYRDYLCKQKGITLPDEF